MAQAPVVCCNCAYGACCCVVCSVIVYRTLPRCLLLCRLSRHVKYIPQPSSLSHLLLVRINEVELVKQQLFSLVLTLGRICMTLMAAIMLVCGLMRPFSSVLCPRHDSCWCRIIAVLPSCSSRQDTPMGPKLGGPVDDNSSAWALQPSQNQTKPCQLHVTALLPDAWRRGWARNFAFL